jgi:cysteine desulfurase/selenocysteine lyase
MRKMDYSATNGMDFNKDPSLFPIKKNCLYLANCAIGPMYHPSLKKVQEFLQMQSESGLLVVEHYGEILSTFREKAASLLETDPNNIAYVSNTATGINMLANGYPFETGDQVLSYMHEFPSNHYPWVLQKKRGVELVLLSDAKEHDEKNYLGPYRWSFKDLEENTTKKTRVITISHAQFASGYAADLEKLGDFCKDRDIDLVIDAAQSLGVLPIYPERYGISAIIASSWKWLLGSRGSGLFYTNPKLREKLQVTSVGDSMMKHRLDYLNHSWDPFTSARKFEYSTLPWEHLISMQKVLEDIFIPYGMEAISKEVFRLQNIFIQSIDQKTIRPILFPSANRSGILSLQLDCDPNHVVAQLRDQDIILTSQGGYLRIAPHFYIEDSDMVRAAQAISESVDILSRTAPLTNQKN